MSRIFIGLASLNALALVGSFALGLISEGRGGVTAGATLSAGQTAFTYHLLGGLFAAIMTLLVHCLVLTYFMGTGRWVQEVVTSYGMPTTLWQRARALKTQALPFVLGSILLIIATATLGAAADRGMIAGITHLVVAACALGFNFWSCLAEHQAIRANGELLEEIMAQVVRMRHERGLA